jgi:hypothetical protein
MGWEGSGIFEGAAWVYYPMSDREEARGNGAPTQKRGGSNLFE